MGRIIKETKKRVSNVNANRAARARSKRLQNNETKKTIQNLKVY